jgi:2-haloacid dehalogenase
MPSPFSPTSIEAVVFDLGGVLIDWNPRYLYRQLFGADVAAMERFLSEVCTPEWNERQDAGRSWEEAIAEASARHPHHAPFIRAYRERWEEMLGGAIQESVRVLEEVRGAGKRLYALTNWSHATFPYALARYDFLGWFEDIVVSGREKLIKPDPAIFQLLLARAGVAAGRTVFIDDAQRNVQGAARLGFHTIHFRDPHQLRRELIEMGVL